MVAIGIGLMEIITEPDFSSSEEAVSFVRELQLILQTIGTCDGRMEGLLCFITITTVLNCLWFKNDVILPLFYYR